MRVPAVRSRMATRACSQRGLRAVEGSFKAGDAVEVVGPEGELVAKGLVAFDSDLLAEIIGTKGGER